MDALKKHLSKQVHTYGPMKLVNLVNQKGHEKPIKDAYERAMAEVQAEMSDVDYQYFDFHAECKHMRWERISLLVDRLKEDLEKLGSGTLRSFWLSILIVSTDTSLS